MSVSAAEVTDIAKRIDGFMTAWGDLNLDTMQSYCQKKLRGKLGAGIRGGVVTFFTDEILAILGALWSAERAHFLLRYDSFVGKGKWFQRPMMGPSSKRIDSVYAQVIDRIEKVLQLVDHMHARALPSQLHMRGKPAALGHRESLAHIRDSLDHAGRIAKVRTVMVPIYRSILANARPMADIDIVEILDSVKENNFYIVPSLVAHQAWFNCTHEIQALLLACTANRAICAYDFKASVVAMRRSDAFTNRWNAIISGSERIPLIRWFELMRAHRVEKMAVYFFNLWQTCASGQHITSAWPRGGRDATLGDGRRQSWAAKKLHSSVGHRFKVPEVATGLFYQLSVSVRSMPLVKTIARFIDRCYNEYSEHDVDHWGADVPVQGLGNDMDVSVHILLDAARLQRDRQRESLSNEQRKCINWHREATSAYMCPEVTWRDQYESKRIVVDERAGTPIKDSQAQVPLSGLNSYPAMMHMAHRAVPSDAPASRLRHWPNLISFITGRDTSPHGAWLFNRPFHHYEMKLHTTFFIFNPDPHIYLCVVCQHQKRVRKDPLVLEFLEAVGQQLTNNMEVTKQAKNLSSGAKSKR